MKFAKFRICESEKLCNKLYFSIVHQDIKLKQTFGATLYNVAFVLIYDNCISKNVVM